MNTDSTIFSDKKRNMGYWDHLEAMTESYLYENKNIMDYVSEITAESYSIIDNSPNNEKWSPLHGLIKKTVEKFDRDTTDKSDRITTTKRLLKEVAKCVEVNSIFYYPYVDENY